MTYRALRYALRHLMRAGFRASIPALVIAVGSVLIFTVITLTGVVEAEAAKVVANGDPRAVGQVVQASLLVSVVSVVLGGFETTVIMGRAVFARRREIGVLRAAGIGDRPIFLIFLIESFLYGMFGGTAGCVVGFCAVVVFSYLSPDVVSLSASIPSVPVAATWAVVLSIAAAILAGSIPAYRATRLPAIQAIYSAW